MSVYPCIYSSEILEYVNYKLPSRKVKALNNLRQRINKSFDRGRYNVKVG